MQPPSEHSSKSVDSDLVPNTVSVRDSQRRRLSTKAQNAPDLLSRYFQQTFVHCDHKKLEQQKTPKVVIKNQRLISKYKTTTKVNQALASLTHSYQERNDSVRNFKNKIANLDLFSVVDDAIDSQDASTV